jgi:hypothetical protein
MKGHLILIALLFLAACGKEKITKSSSYSLSALQSTGVSLHDNGGYLTIICDDVSVLRTNQERLDQLMAFRDTIRLNTNDVYQYGSVNVNRIQMSSLINEGIFVLQQSAMQSLFCPSNQLAPMRRY